MFIRRILLLLTVAAMMVAGMAVSAAPTFALPEDFLSKSLFGK